jgi:hypothetical protein
VAEFQVREVDRICERIGIYNFETGDGTITESLTKREVPEVPVPRPIVRKRKIERWDPMKAFKKDHSILHQRWGHKSGLRQTIRFQGCLGLPMTYKELTNSKCICEACLMAKMCKCVHPPVFRRLWLIRQLVHFDLHYKPFLSWCKKQYTLMCVEHVAKYSKVLFMLKKSSAFNQCLIFMAWIS